MFFSKGGTIGLGAGGGNTGCLIGEENGSGGLAANCRGGANGAGGTLALSLENNGASGIFAAPVGAGFSTGNCGKTGFIFGISGAAVGPSLITPAGGDIGDAFGVSTVITE